MWSPHQTSYRQVEAGGAILALIVAVGRELMDCAKPPRLPQNLSESAVNFGVPAAALLVVEPAPVAHTGQNHAVPDTVHAAFVQRKPGDGADRAGNKKEAVGVTQLRARQMLCQVRGHAYAGQIVVAQRGMAGM